MIEWKKNYENKNTDTITQHRLENYGKCMSKVFSIPSFLNRFWNITRVIFRVISKLNQIFQNSKITFCSRIQFSMSIILSQYRFSAGLCVQKAMQTMVIQSSSFLIISKVEKFARKIFKSIHIGIYMNQKFISILWY